MNAYLPSPNQPLPGNRAIQPQNTLPTTSLIKLFPNFQ